MGLHVLSIILCSQNNISRLCSKNKPHCLSCNQWCIKEILPLSHVTEKAVATMYIQKLSGVFISVFNQLDGQNQFHNKFYFMPLHVSSTCAHHQEVKIALHSLWYQHNEISEWSKITKIQFYKYEQIVVKFMCEFFGCDYCVLLTVNMLCHVEVMFIQLLDSLERYYVYLLLFAHIYRTVFQQFQTTHLFSV